MADKNEVVPDYLKDLFSLSAEELWVEMAERFWELNDLIGAVRLETKEQAVHQRHGISTVDGATYWEEPEVASQVRPWLQIHYHPDRDIEHFMEVWESARNLADKVEPLISKRQMSVELLWVWGAFCRYASVIEYEYLRDRPNLQHLAGASAQSRRQHRIWFSHLYMALQEDGDRRVEVEGRILDRIREILERNHFPDPDFPRKWFRQFCGLGPYGSDDFDDLASSFKQNKLSFKEIKRLSGEPLTGLPPLD